MKMISFNQIGFRYRLGSQVFRDFSMTLSPGHVYGVLGENGVGKSTLMKLASGVLIPTAGSVTIDGREASLREEATMAKIIYLPEEFSLPALTLDEFRKVTAPFYPSFSDESFEEYCRVLDVVRDRRLDKLSMGQRKRAYLAFAFACRAEWLLLDEPTNGLDVAAKEAFRRLVARYVDEGQSIIISTHSVREIDSLIDHLIILDRKGIVLDASIGEIGSRLRFGRCSAEEEPLYSESTLAGTSGVMVNTTDEESPVDIEMLFMSSLRSTERLRRLFNTKTE
ncbi:MAG: ABC transporter ATP-binding protein [Tidjanibacter sp.]|nr:ABC transporter ATP-binding protein [Tidjanibacter sp.]